MKFLLILIPLVLAGCRTTTPVPTKPAPVPAFAVPPAWTAATSPPIVTPPSSSLEQRVRQQTQIIEALVSQNDALTAKLDAKPEAPVSAAPIPAAPTLITAPGVSPRPPTPFSSQPPPPAPVALAITPPVPSAPAPSKAEEPLLMPNADGVIDLSVRPTAESDAPTNPFVVRPTGPESAREITLHVGGIIAGPVACAVINDRLVQAGENLESLAIERIEHNAVFLRYDGRRLRLPVSTRPVRVRLPL